MNIKRILVAGLAALSIGVTIVTIGGNTAEASTRCTDRVLRRGSRGDCVRFIQRLYNDQVKNNGIFLVGLSTIAEDGVFGPQTRSAMVSFQSRLGIGVDGVVGNQTWGSLCMFPYRGLPLTRGSVVYIPRRYHMSIETWWAAGCQKYFPGVQLKYGS